MQERQQKPKNQYILMEDLIMNNNENGKVISINELKTLAVHVLNDFEEVANQKKQTP